jgi:hypothetical protein
MAACTARSNVDYVSCSCETSPISQPGDGFLLVSLQLGGRPPGRSHGTSSALPRTRTYLVKPGMVEPSKNDPLCIRCNIKMRSSCKEIEKLGFVHDVFECPKCRSTQSYVTPEQTPRLGVERRENNDRRLAETRGRKQKNDVRKSGDSTTIEGRANSHRKTSFLFSRSGSGAR